MPTGLGELTTAGGGGAEVVNAATIWTLAGSRATATTIGLDGRLAVGATAVTGAMATWGKAVVGAGIRRAVPLTAHASTKGAIVATLNAGLRAIRITLRRTAAGCWTYAVMRWRAIFLSTRVAWRWRRCRRRPRGAGGGRHSPARLGCRSGRTTPGSLPGRFWAAGAGSL
jgi:hypothetical protein